MRPPPRPPAAPFLAAAGALLLAAAAQAPPPAASPPASASPPPLNVVLVSIDSLRADHLPAYGYPRATAPFLTALAERPGAALFSRVTAVAPSCHPSHATMLTGLYPQQVGVVFCGEDLVFKPADEELDAATDEELADYQRLLSSSPAPLVRRKTSAVMNWLRIPVWAPTLATFLHARGYATGGFVSIWTIAGRFGYARGFDRFEDEMPSYYGPPRLAWLLGDLFHGQRRRPGADTLAAALDFLDHRPPDRPFFVFLHFADTHVPYAAPPEITFAGESDAERRAVTAAWARRYPPQTYERAMAKMGKGGQELLLDTYDRAIRYVDSLLARFVAALDAKGLAERTLIVVLADHGDSFGQHFYLSKKFADRLFFEHSVYVWEETQHVPLIVVDPRRHEAAAVRTGNASTVDVVPTVLGALGLDAADFGAGALPGRDLLRADEEPRRVYFLTFGRGRPGVLEDFFLDYPRFIGFREGDLKFFIDRDRFKDAGRGRCFAFELGSDPDELHDLCADPAFAPRAERFRGEVVAWYNGTVEERRDIPPRRRRRPGAAPAEGPGEPPPPPPPPPPQGGPGSRPAARGTGKR
jgi:arylsulfatase A-like enzyme